MDQREKQRKMCKVVAQSNVLVRAAGLTMGTLTGWYGWINEGNREKCMRLARNPIGSAAYKYLRSSDQDLPQRFLEMSAHCQ